MTKSSGMFVKINYKINGANKLQGEHRAKNYKDTAVKKYVLCGGSYFRNRGTIIFHANNFKEAEEIINNNPFVSYEDYSFEILSKNSISLGHIYH
ncbi:hypothetical protein [Clostridium sp.]|uniref:hypothetical protein n=1 Tax=Clostridium sp. TaxID=1506 RepID=UPI002612F5B0|nr:hypothetical protein [Clostridium sp.]